MREFLSGLLWFLVMQGTIAAGIAVVFLLPASLGLTSILLIYLLRHDRLLLVVAAVAQT